MKGLVVLCFFGLSLIKSAASECTAGWAIKNRNYIDSASWDTKVSPDTKFSCDGMVTEWRLQAKASYKLRALVLRPIAGSPTKFNFVGFNDIPADKIQVNTPITYVVPADERFSVQAGDVIGWSVGKSVLAWNYASGGTKILYQYNKVVNGFEGSPINIASGSSGREYSIAATVKPGEYQYLGCFVDKGAPNRAVPDYRMDSRDGLTIEMCATHCENKGSRYFSVQAGYACFCGSDGISYDRYGEAADSQCSTNCKGDATQKCGGSWRNSVYDFGAQPTCDNSGASICSAGWAIRNRNYIDSASWDIKVSPDTKFTCDGVVTEWQLQAKASYNLRVVVFRPISGSTTKFEVVGFNDIPADKIAVNTPVTFTVPCQWRINVKAGDVIGWSVGKSVLAWNQAPGTKVLYQYNKVINGFEGSPVNIASGSDGREYSIKAIVKPAT